MGTNDDERRATYRERFATQLDPNALRAVRSCLQTGTPLRNARFRPQIEQELGVKVGYSPRGKRNKSPSKPEPNQDINKIREKGWRHPPRRL
jgi:hypothetical protein